MARPRESNFPDSVLIDDEDRVRLQGRSVWLDATRGGYAMIWIHPKSVPLHRWILGVEGRDVHVDHRNGNRLDNRRCNIRLVTPQENAQNRTGRHARNSTGYRGVYRRGCKKPSWFAAACIGGRMNYLGTYSTPEAADEVVRKFRLEHMTGALS